MKLFAEYIRDERLKLDKSVFGDVVCTYQDPCNVSRNGGLWNEARFIVKHITDRFVEMDPCGPYAFCCGGGGGNIPMGGVMRQRRMEQGKVKAEQIRKTGAEIVITPCHNCYDQINDLNKTYELGVKVLSFKEMFDECMIIPEELLPKEDEGD